MAKVAYMDANGSLNYRTISNSSAGNIKTEYCIPVIGGGTQVTSFFDVTARMKPKGVQSRVPKQLKADEVSKNPSNYPKIIGYDGNIDRYKYDYTVGIQKNIMNAIQDVKKNMNIPSAYSRLELNKLFHTKFNRFRIQYPDYFMNNTLAYVVLTRPDLNLFNSDGSLHSQVSNDPQLFYIAKADLQTAKSLTKSFTSKHHFNPILSNTLTSLDISDESIDTLETGETFTGYKTQYAKSNIRSMTAGTISLKFPETYNMAITHAHQMWCSYESGVYRGSLKPKDKYIWGKELDYACDIYYFLLDAEDMIIRYWCKYTGCFPLSVNKSIFSYDVGSEVNHPELSVTYAYFTREDMSALTLNEFNNNSGGNSSGFRYNANYIPSIGSVGETWSDAPFVEPISRKTGFTEDSRLYALRFRPK